MNTQISIQDPLTLFIHLEHALVLREPPSRKQFVHGMQFVLDLRPKAVRPVQKLLPIRSARPRDDRLVTQVSMNLGCRIGG